MRNLSGIDLVVAECTDLYFDVTSLESTMNDGGEELFTAADAAAHVWQALEYLKQIQEWRNNGRQTQLDMKGVHHGS